MNSQRPPHSLVEASHQAADQSTYMVFGQVAEQVERSLAAGCEPDVEALVADHPELEEPIRELVPALVALNELGQEPPDVGQSLESDEQRLGTLGDFRILREIGRGGMGVVYEAEQISLRRRVALKVLPFAAVLAKHQLQRFKNEALAAASLDHPGIVAIYSVGCERGVHFYAMQLVEGQSLAEVIVQLRRLAGLDTPEREQPPDEMSELASDLATGRFAPTGDDSGGSSCGNEPTVAHGTACPPTAQPPATTQVELQAAISTERSTDSPKFFRTVAALGIQAAEALDHAHQHGIVHRDVKPANLLLDSEGHLQIADFGLARIDTSTSMTVTGDLLGTVRYMSPEQAAAKRAVVDHRTDIYSLGVTLYELLTLQPAFMGHDRQQLLSAIAMDEPLAPRRINPAIPADLETVILKAIQKEPEARYATAQDLADDLKRFLDGKPIEARRPSLVERVTKWSRRHRTGVATAIAATFGVLLAAAVLFGFGQRREAALRARSDENLQLALDAVDQIYLQYADVRFGSLLADARPAEKQKLQPEAETFLSKALTFYEQFAQANHDTVTVRYETAKAYGRIGNIRRQLGMDDNAQLAFAKGVAIAEQLIQQYPTETKYKECLARLHLLRSLAYGQCWNLEQAIAELTKAIRLNPDYAEAYHLRGQAYAARQDFKHALADYDQSVRSAARLYPKLPFPHYYRGAVYLKMGDFDKAIADFDTAIQFAPKFAMPYVTRGVAYAEKGDYARAITDLSEALRLDPDRATAKAAYAHRAAAYQHRRDYTRAIADYSELVRMEPNNPLHYSNRALAYEFQGDFDRALADFNRSLERAPGFPLACCNRGELYVKMGQFDKALNDLNTVIRRDPKNPNGYRARGEMYMEQGQLQKGAVDLTKAVQLKPKLAVFYFRQALALLATDQVDRYRAACAAILDRYATSQKAIDQFWAAWTCVLAPDAVGDLQPVIALAEKSVETNPNSIPDLRMLGAVLYRAGRIDAAIARLTQADRLAASSDPPPENRPIYTWYFLAMTHAAAGHTDQAQQWLAKAVNATDEELAFSEPDARSKVPWNRRLALKIIRKEAQRKVAGHINGEAPL